jgi:Ca-activated chloride channel family protein
MVSTELLTLRLRYRTPDSDTSERIDISAINADNWFADASPDFRFVAAVAAFGMLLGESEHEASATYDAVLDMATGAQGPDVHGHRTEMLEMVRRANLLARH